MPGSPGTNNLFRRAARMAAPKTAKLTIPVPHQKSPARAQARLSSDDLVSMADLSPQDFQSVLALAETLKANPRDFRSALDGQQLVLIFEKPSLRTRVTFEAGMKSLGGDAIFLDQRGS